MCVTKVISGGQTGVDQAALDVAIQQGLSHGGWCPLGRRCEAGTIPEKYQLSPTRSTDYAVRTEQNVVDSDGTLVLYRGVLTGGTAWTVHCLQRHRKPYFLIDFDRTVGCATRDQVRSWLRQQRIFVLNVAGPRASSHPEMGRRASDFLGRLLERPTAARPGGNS
ncbi:MAG: putative molybdenum carrier protein [Mariniblastus sp.]|nr:putative molybdenum carrier protein [Mariniblastus sp.]